MGLLPPMSLPDIIFCHLSRFRAYQHDNVLWPHRYSALRNIDVIIWGGRGGGGVYLCSIDCTRECLYLLAVVHKAHSLV